MTFYAVTTIIFFIVAVPSSIYDIKKMRIPLYYVLAGFFIMAGFYVYCFKFKIPPFFVNCIAGSFLSALLMIAARFITEGGLGWGDVIFSAFAGLYLSIPYCFIAAGISALCGLIFYLLTSGIKKRFSEKGTLIKVRFSLPYIPFITAGTFLTVLVLFLNR